MKKILSLLLTVITLFASQASIFADGNNPDIYLNGTKMEFEENTAPFIKDERTLIPMRAIFTAVGAVVQWDEDTRTVIAIKDNSFVTLQVGTPTAFINGEEHVMDVSAEIYNDSTFVPLRFVSEALGAKVEWDNENYIVNITSE